MDPPVVIMNDRFDEEEPAGKPYRLVRLSDDDDDSSTGDYSSQENVSILSPSSFWYRNILPDDWFEIKGILILDGVEAVRFLKLVVVTFVGIVLIHWLAALMNWEHDSSYSLADMIVYDSISIMLDIMTFYIVSRLYKKRGVDHVAFLGMSFLSAIYMSMESNFRFLRYSVSLYEMHCVWPWQLWLFVAIVIPLVSIIIIKHVQYAVNRGWLVMKLMEVTLIILFFLVPVVSSPNFHFHHWYAGFLAGMIFNFDVWWSRATMAWCWGMYMQGIGVWGRDPILTCAYGYYISTDEACPYMSCYLQPTDDNTTEPHYRPLEQPDWRNCSGYIP